MVATQATCVTIQHLMKTVLLAPVALPTEDITGLLVALVIGSVVGNMVGIHALSRITDNQHKNFQRAILCLLGFALLCAGIYDVIRS